MQNKSKRLKEKISDVIDELKNSNFYQIDFLSALGNCVQKLAPRKIEEIVCYGLGSFSNGIDVASRFQLALLVLLFNHLKELGLPLGSVIEAYDPSFDRLDVETLLLFSSPKFKIIKENEYCGREVATANKNRCVLVFMPHLDKYLYNNLLGANWTSGGLSSLVVLGNSFREMIDNEPTSKCVVELHYLNQLVQNFPPQVKKKKSNAKLRESDTDKRHRVLVELAIDDSSFHHSDIFNSFSIHFVNNQTLEENLEKVEQCKLVNWTCVTSFQCEDVWTID